MKNFIAVCFRWKNDSPSIHKNDVNELIFFKVGLFCLIDQTLLEYEESLVVLEGVIGKTWEQANFFFKESFLFAQVIYYLVTNKIVKTLCT